MILFTGAAAILVGAVLGWSELVGIGVGLLAIAGLVRFVFRSPASASWVDLSVPVRVTRGDFAAVEVAISVSGSWRWVSAVGSDRRPAEPELSWPIDTYFRGSYLVGPETLEFADPFGFSSEILCSRELTQVLVVPRLLPVSVPASNSALGEGLMAEQSGMEHFHSVREYAVGDPMRSIHWKSSARTGTLMVRRMVDTTASSILVVLDTDISSYQRTVSQFVDPDRTMFEDAVDLAASWAWHSCSALQSVVVSSTEMGAGLIRTDLRNRESVLDWLALITLSDSQLPNRVLEVVRSQHISRVVVVSGVYPSVAIRNLVAGLNRSCSVELVQLKP
jgi:uncharacterized protein (DUF58 family)